MLLAHAPKCEPMQRIAQARRRYRIEPFQTLWLKRPSVGSACNFLNDGFRAASLEQRHDCRVEPTQLFSWSPARAAG
jgi:hypothetical protein